MDENTKRINDVFDYLLYKHIIKGQEDIANAIKTSRPNITAMLNGKKSVTTETLRKINNAFPGIFSVEWLLNGEGEMLVSEQTEKRQNPQLSYVDELIASLEKQVKDKDKQLADKDRIIKLLEQKIEYLEAMEHIDSDDIVRKHPFPVGAAEDVKIQPNI